MTAVTDSGVRAADTTHMDTLKQFTTEQLRAALERAWSEGAVEQLRAELAARDET